MKLTKDWGWLIDKTESVLDCATNDSFPSQTEVSSSHCRWVEQLDCTSRFWLMMKRGCFDDKLLTASPAKCTACAYLVRGLGNPELLRLESVLDSTSLYIMQPSMSRQVMSNLVSCQG